jgi:hypothetical protein
LPDKSVYHGEFFFGKKQGQGKFVWPDGSSYVGNWKNGKISGIVNLLINIFSRGFINGLKEDLMKEIGLIIKCMAMEHTFGKMEGDISLYL